MAQDQDTNLLARMSTNRLGNNVPALGGDREVAEPTEREDREIEVGRRPEDVVQAREKPPVKGTEADDAPVVPKKWKVKGEELSLDEIAKRGWMDAIIQSAEQLPAVQKKHQELLEKVADKNLVGNETAKPAVVAAPAPPTPEQILKTYLPVAQERAKLGYIEPDFVEAYPQHAATLSWYADMIDELTTTVGHIRNWIGAEVQKRNFEAVNGALNTSIDKVAAKLDAKGNPDPMVATLKDPEVRKTFETWLRTEIDPKVNTLTPESMFKYWLSFNADALLEFATKAAEKPAAPARPRAHSDGSPSRPGKPETPPVLTGSAALLERMNSERLGPEA